LIFGIDFLSWFGLLCDARRQMHGRSRRKNPPLFYEVVKNLAGGGGPSRFYGMESFVTDKPPQKLTESKREKLMRALDKIDGEILQIERELAEMGYSIPMLVGQTAPAKRANQVCGPLPCRPSTSRPSKIRGVILFR
jgi:hypothetical protein